MDLLELAEAAAAVSSPQVQHQQRQVLVAVAVDRVFSALELLLPQRLVVSVVQIRTG